MNASSRFVPVRDALQQLRRDPKRPSYDLSKTVFPKIDAQQVVRTLDGHGYAAGLTLPESSFTQILDFAFSNPCYGNFQPTNGFLYGQKLEAESLSHQTFYGASYFNINDLCPAVKRLAEDPLLLQVAADYFERRPLHVDSRLWWTFATAAENYNVSTTASFFHYDIDDYTALRCFFYLTDVDSQSGPHLLIKGSHRQKKLSQIISLGERPERSILNSYGRDRLVTICGKARTGFMEDPFCFHRGSRPVAKDRLVLQLRYAARDYGVLKSTADSDSLRQII